MYCIGLDIGGTKCAATLGKLSDGIEIIDKERFATAGLTPTEVLEHFASFIADKTAEYEISGIGISCGGPLDGRRGIILSPPGLPGWDNIEIVDYFTSRFGIPTRLCNDADACAVAEWKYGAGKGCDNVVFLTFGTGFGAGLILGGRLYRGANDNAGEIGHVRLTRSGPVGYRKAGSCEGYCSGAGIARLAAIMTKNKRFEADYERFTAESGGETTAKTLAEGARKGNGFCRAVYRKSGEMLGRTLSIIVDLLNPERIIIGGVFMRSGELLLPYAEKVMKKECLPFSLGCVKIVRAGLGENVGDYAALAVSQGDFQNEGFHFNHSRRAYRTLSRFIGRAQKHFIGIRNHLDRIRKRQQTAGVR